MASHHVSMTRLCNRSATSRFCANVRCGVQHFLILKVSQGAISRLKDKTLARGWAKKSQPSSDSRPRRRSAPRVRRAPEAGRGPLRGPVPRRQVPRPGEAPCSSSLSPFCFPWSGLSTRRVQTPCIPPTVPSHSKGSGVGIAALTTDRKPATLRAHPSNPNSDIPAPFPTDRFPPILPFFCAGVT